jgi:hypothetical protein
VNVPLRDALAALYSDFDANQLAERHAAAARLVADEQRDRVRRIGDRISPFTIRDLDDDTFLQPTCSRKAR